MSNESNVAIMNTNAMKAQQEFFQRMAANDEERVVMLEAAIGHCRTMLHENLHHETAYQQIESLRNRYRYELKIINGTDDGKSIPVVTITEATAFFLEHGDDTDGYHNSPHPYSQQK